MSLIFDTDSWREWKHLNRTLARIGRPDRSPLPLKIIRWLELGEVPLVARVGLVERPAGEDVEAFLAAEDSAPVEPPVVTQLEAGAGVSVRRSLAYSQQGRGLFVEARYVIDNGNPAAVVMVHAGDRSPASLIAALDDLDAAARCMRVVDGWR
jgi:hypothetical protein